VSVVNFEHILTISFDPRGGWMIFGSHLRLRFHHIAKLDVGPKRVRASSDGFGNDKSASVN
jgi:hypothetical protein